MTRDYRIGRWSASALWIGGAAVGLLAAGLVLSGCGEHGKPNFIYMPDMVYSPAQKAQETEEGKPMRTPVEGTVARGQRTYAYANDPVAAGQKLRNPLQRTKNVLARGKDKFNVYCAVCHGPGGEGDGSVVPKFPRPPSLLSDKIRDFPDGRIYHIITAGQNLMPSYSSQVESDDRWAIVHYIRVLHRAKNPTQSDLQKAKNW